MKGCAVAGCTRLHVARGMCGLHWRRWRKHGDPLVTLVERRSIGVDLPAVCSVESCGEARSARGLCKRHYERLRLHGDPLASKGAGFMRAEKPTYSTVHARLKNQRGRAAGFDCVDCSAPASEWSYDGTDASPLMTTTPTGASIAYSTDLDRYEPRCRPCHRLRDAAERKLPATAPEKGGLLLASTTKGMKQ